MLISVNLSTRWKLIAAMEKTTKQNTKNKIESVWIFGLLVLQNILEKSMSFSVVLLLQLDESLVVEVQIPNSIKKRNLSDTIARLLKNATAIASQWHWDEVLRKFQLWHEKRIVKISRSDATCYSTFSYISTFTDLEIAKVPLITCTKLKIDS